MSEVENSIQTAGKKMTTFGVIAIILGILAMLAPGITGASVAMFLGILVLIAGIMRIVWAFQSETFGRGALIFVIGGLTLACGIALLANPLFAVGVMSIIMAIYFIVDGIGELIAGMKTWGNSGGWLVFSGIVSIMLGGMIWKQYPLSGAYAMGILIGIKLFFIGLTMITGGSVVRAASRE